MNSANSPAQIAIIGMAGLFPGAKDLATYWQNILSKVSAIREMADYIPVKGGFLMISPNSIP